MCFRFAHAAAAIKRVPSASRCIGVEVGRSDARLRSLGRSVALDYSSSFCSARCAAWTPKLVQLLREILHGFQNLLCCVVRQCRARLKFGMRIFEPALKCKSLLRMHSDKSAMRSYGASASALAPSVDIALSTLLAKVWTSPWFINVNAAILSSGPSFGLRLLLLLRRCGVPSRFGFLSSFLSFAALCFFLVFS